jgi:hypothetical protein
VKANCQTIDTVSVRNLQLQAQDWAWLVGKYGDTNEDSATSYQVRRIRDKIRTVNPASWTTNVTIDSIPGKIVLAMYNGVKNAPAGEIASRYAAITSAISGKSNMIYWTNIADAIWAGYYTKFRDRGKTILLDN